MFCSSSHAAMPPKRIAARSRCRHEQATRSLSNTANLSAPDYSRHCAALTAYRLLMRGAAAAMSAHANGRQDVASRVRRCRDGIEETATLLPEFGAPSPSHRPYRSEYSEFANRCLPPADNAHHSVTDSSSQPTPPVAARGRITRNAAHRLERRIAPKRPAAHHARHAPLRERGMPSVNGHHATNRPCYTRGGNAA